VSPQATSGVNASSAISFLAARVLGCATDDSTERSSSDADAMPSDAVALDHVPDYGKMGTVRFEPGCRAARVLYALSHLATAWREDTTYRQQREAFDLLDDVLEAVPDHPGAHHDTVHARDFPPLAEGSVETARAREYLGSR